MALNGCNNCFVGVDEEGDIVCNSSTAGDTEMIQVYFLFHRKSLFKFKNICNRIKQLRFLVDAMEASLANDYPSLL